jgi:hypothetical protein
MRYNGFAAGALMASLLKAQLHTSPLLLSAGNALALLLENEAPALRFKHVQP